MAEERTEGPRAYSVAGYFLGLALACVATEGKAVFSGQVQGSHLGYWLRRGFPANHFEFWTEKGPKRELEAWALLMALRELVESQWERVRSSATIEENPIPRFWRLYREHLSRASSALVGRTTGPMPAAQPEEPDLPESQRPESPEEAAVSGIGQDQLRAAYEEHERRREVREKEFAQEACEMQAEGLVSGPEDRDWRRRWDPVLSLQRQKLVESDLDATTAEAIADQWRASRSALSEDLGPFDEIFARLDRGFLTWLEYDEIRKLTEGELDALRAALSAILGGAYWGSRRDDSLSRYLTQAQMRSLRRACRKSARVKPYLQELSGQCVRIRDSARAMDRDDDPDPEGKRKRRRTGRAFSDLAKEVQEGGREDVAAGLRAVDKRLWGHELTAEERASEEIATRWFKEEWRQTVLKGQPDAESFAIAVLRDGSTAIADAFCQWALGLALFCWPEGILHSPSSTPPPPE